MKPHSQQIKCLRFKSRKQFHKIGITPHKAVRKQNTKLSSQIT
jgi:hypothetical protein